MPSSIGATACEQRPAFLTVPVGGARLAIGLTRFGAVCCIDSVFQVRVQQAINRSGLQCSVPGFRVHSKECNPGTLLALHIQGAKPKPDTPLTTITASGESINLCLSPKSINEWADSRFYRIFNLFSLTPGANNA